MDPAVTLNDEYISDVMMTSLVYSSLSVPVSTQVSG